MADSKVDQQVKAIYKKAKRYLVTLALFVSSFVIVSQVILPQIASVGNIKDQIGSQKTSVELAETSLSVLSVIDDRQLNSDFDLVVISLPKEKDIVLMFQVLSSAAKKSNTELGGFNIEVGSVFDRDNQARDKKTVDGIPFLNIVVKVSGNEEQLINFARELYASIPIVELNSVRISSTDGTFDINYYFKQINNKGIAQTTRVTALTPQEKSLLERLYEWE